MQNDAYARFLLGGDCVYNVLSSGCCLEVFLCGQKTKGINLYTLVNEKYN